MVRLRVEAWFDCESNGRRTGSSAQGVYFYAGDGIEPGALEPEDSEPEETGPALYTREFWGEWLQLDADVSWYITSRTVSRQEQGAAPVKVPASSIVLASKGSGVIEAAWDGQKALLFASRVANAQFTFSVKAPSSSASAFASRSVTGVVPTVVSASDPNIAATVTEEGDHFVVDGAIPGEEYLVTVNGRETSVTPGAPGVDVGTIAVVESGVNFKTTILPRDSAVDMMELYNGIYYDLVIQIENTGDAVCSAPTYEVQGRPAGYVGGTFTVNGLEITNLRKDDGAPYSKLLGSIVPQGKKTLFLRVRYPGSAADLNETPNVEIPITIIDDSGTRFEDKATLQFHPFRVSFRIVSSNIVSSAASEISGVIMTPSAKAVRFTTEHVSSLDVQTPGGYLQKFYNATFSTPWTANEEYVVAFSGATAATEVVYTLAVGVTPDYSSLLGFEEPSRYEPNNTVETATTLNLTEENERTVTAYLAQADIDYYRVNLGTLTKALISPPENLTGRCISTGLIDLSWDAVVGAGSYKVYRATSSDGDYLPMGESSTTSYSDTVPNDATYYYKVSAVVNDLESDTSFFTAVAAVVGTIPSLSPDTWTSGVSGSSPQYYQFDASGGYEYRVWWDDFFDGSLTADESHTQTGDIQVTAYQGGTTLFSGVDHGYTTPQAITAASSGNVILKVERSGTSTGTFRIAYSTSSSRPAVPQEAVTLSSGIWQDGSLTGSVNTAAYKFYASAGSYYYIWWDDWYSGSGGYTANIAVTATQGSTTYFSGVDSGYTSYRSIYASSSGYITLQVAPYYSGGTGTFRIVYSTSSTRPATAAQTTTTLSSGTWQSGSLTSSVNTAAYKFYASAGSYYYIWWDDSYNGSGSCTADVTVTATQGSTMYFSEDSAYTSCRSIYASSSGYITLQVQPYSSGDTGTFRIVYSTSSTRPQSVSRAASGLSGDAGAGPARYPRGFQGWSAARIAASLVSPLMRSASSTR